MNSSVKIYKNVIIGTDQQARQLPGLARLKVDVIFRNAEDSKDVPIFTSFEYVDFEKTNRFKEVIDANKTILIQTSSIRKSYVQFAKLMMIGLNYKLKDVVVLINQFKLNKDEAYDLTKDCECEMIAIEYDHTKTNTHSLAPIIQPVKTRHVTFQSTNGQPANGQPIVTRPIIQPIAQPIGQPIAEQPIDFVDYDEQDDKMEKELTQITDIVGIAYKETVLSMLKTGMTSDAIINTLFS